MSFTIRRMTEADYEAAARIASGVYNETVTAESIRFEISMMDERCKWAAWLAEVGGEPVGVGQYSQLVSFYHPQKFQVNVQVLPAYRGRGIGTALYNQLMEALAPFDPISLTGGAREDWPDTLAFLTKRGWEERLRNWESHLAVPEFDPAPWQGLLAEVSAKGYTVKRLSELQAEPGWNHRLYELIMELRRDVPSHEPWQDVPYEQWAKVLSNPHFFPEGYMVGLHGDRWVGVSALWKSDDEGVLTVGLTGVQREHRGSGIAKAMKVRAIEAAREFGAKKIKTWNESNNQRMLAINDQLGFVRQPAWIFFQKKLKEEA
ncbi:MAG: GNAT family N-acetyltransferase [Bacillota bacterium]